jgi:peptidoglycan/xylan/chitin deacetylase (PgdA/CDA1 family)
MFRSEASKPKNPSDRVKVAVRGRLSRVATVVTMVCTIAALAPSFAGAAGGEHKNKTPNTKSPLALAAFSFTQSGPEAILTIRTRKPVVTSMPGTKGNLCATFAYGTKILPRRRYCVVQVGKSQKTVVKVDRLDGRTGKILARSTQHISTHQGTRFVLRFDPLAAGLPVGIVHLSVRSNWRAGTPCKDGTSCVDGIPAGGATVPQRIYRAVAAGCTPSSGQVTNGSRNGKRVAITFDDGPSAYTASYVASLRAEHAVATFFQIGQQIPGQGAIERSILSTGSALGDHTWTHADISGGGALASSQLSRTKKQIETTAGGYVPCLFRPPYGATSSALVSVGGSLGMKSVLWDVDTNDWQLPGTSAIISRAVGGARAGSIILMHDGGGNRSQTAAAVRPVIRGLRAKGYTLVTVPQLLGLKTRWRLSKS